MNIKRVTGFPGLYREELGKEGTRYRIRISRNKKAIQKYFYFGVGQSEAEARAKAIRRWNEIREASPVITRVGFAQIERRKSRSGIVGVTRVTEEVKGHPYDFWVANFTDQRGNKRSRKFSVNNYGEDKAKELAVKTRLDGLAEMK